MKYNFIILSGFLLHHLTSHEKVEAGRGRRGREGAYAQKWCMRNHCQGQQGKCPQCAENIQCCALFLTSLAACSVYSSKQSKARPQAESWAALILSSLLLARSLAPLGLPQRLALAGRAWPGFRGKLVLMASMQPACLGEPGHWHEGRDER